MVCVTDGSNRAHDAFKVNITYNLILNFNLDWIL